PWLVQIPHMDDMEPRFLFVLKLVETIEHVRSTGTVKARFPPVDPPIVVELVEEPQLWNERPGYFRPGPVADLAQSPSDRPHIGWTGISEQTAEAVLERVEASEHRCNCRGRRRRDRHRGRERKAAAGQPPT